MLSEDELREAILLIFANKQVKQKYNPQKSLVHFSSYHRIYQMP
jgi:hypothetical protein